MPVPHPLEVLPWAIQTKGKGLLSLPCRLFPEACLVVSQRLSKWLFLEEVSESTSLLGSSGGQGQLWNILTSKERWAAIGSAQILRSPLSTVRFVIILGLLGGQT
jgi:hypothetical protein